MKVYVVWVNTENGKAALYSEDDAGRHHSWLDLDSWVVDDRFIEFLWSLGMKVHDLRTTPK